MRRLSIVALVLGLMRFWGASCALGQSMDDLNLQVHGYATQGFIYSTNNNWNTTDSSNGSAAWTEAVVNVTAQPESKLRIGVQARFYLLGTFGNQITLDWAEGDYKVNDRFGIRAGKVKSPSGLLNESQDIDPAHLWILLPQSIYPLADRNAKLAHYGGVAYGSVALGERLGRMEYRGYGGERVTPGDDGYFQLLRDYGLTVPNGLSGAVYGGTIRWVLPVAGLMVGATAGREQPTGRIIAGPLQGELTVKPLVTPFLFGQYERKRAMFGGEYTRLATGSTVQFNGLPGSSVPFDQRAYYVMGSYKLSNKLTGGVYFSSVIDHQAAFTSARYQKDWTISSRYDFNPYIYLKAEEHVMDGTLRGYSTSDNTNGLKPSTRMTMLKVGVSF